jgi:hypothetical protein
MTENEELPIRYSESIAGSPITSAPNDAVMIRGLPVGSRVKLRDGSIAEVTANPDDGGWLFVHIVESDGDPSKVGSDDMAFCVDVVGIL